MLSSTRIPQPNKDKLITYEDSRHIVVMHNGNYYTVDVINEKGLCYIGNAFIIRILNATKLVLESLFI